jgi:2-polyprenyl-6-methoxyphenol hydroxylase-like FAD-dependent oxidoreductase
VILSRLYKPDELVRENFVLQSNAMNTSHSSYEIIIAGGGPVGLFLACELALAQCSVLILEKAENPASPIKRLPFGLRGLSAPSVEALDRRGLLEELEIPKRLTEPHMPSGNSSRRQTGHFAGIPFYEDQLDTTQWPYRLPGSAPTHLLAEMEELETVLTRRAEALGVTIRRGLAVTGLRQTESGVIVQAGPESFQGQWLIGCDGARSAVRKLGGFDFAGTDPEFTGYSVQVDVADPQKLRPGRNHTATGLYLQSRPGYFAIQDFDGGAFHHSGEPLTLAHIQKVLRRISGTDVTLTAVHAATSWTDRARQATAYRNGHVLLAGDAAHIHSPLGGQGLNLGLGDALNLGWKLAALIRRGAPETLLDTYQAERHPVGEQVLAWSRAQVAAMKPDPTGRALLDVFRDMIGTRDGATYVAGRVWGIFNHYPLPGSHPLTGRSAPHFTFDDGTTLAEHLRQGQGLLLDFKSNTSLETFFNQRYSYIRYRRLRPAAPSDLSALLIRPDGIVAWATNDTVDWQELEIAIRE